MCSADFLYVMCHSIGEAEALSSQYDIIAGLELESLLPHLSSGSLIITKLLRILAQSPHHFLSKQSCLVPLERSSITKIEVEPSEEKVLPNTQKNESLHSSLANARKLFTLR